MKKWYQSKTILFNTAALALSALEAKLHVLQPVLPVDIYAITAVVLPVANILLRTATNQPIAKK